MKKIEPFMGQDRYPKILVVLVGDAVFSGRVEGWAGRATGLRYRIELLQLGPDDSTESVPDGLKIVVNATPAQLQELGPQNGVFLQVDMAYGDPYPKTGVKRLVFNAQEHDVFKVFNIPAATRGDRVRAAHYSVRRVRAENGGEFDYWDIESSHCDLILKEGELFYEG